MKLFFVCSASSSFLDGRRIRVPSVASARYLFRSPFGQRPLSAPCPPSRAGGRRRDPSPGRAGGARRATVGSTGVSAGQVIQRVFFWTRSAGASQLDKRAPVLLSDEPWRW